MTDKTVEQVHEQARIAAHRYEQAQAALVIAGMAEEFAIVPIDQLASMYERFLRLTRLGTATIKEWQSMPKEVAVLRHAIFRQSDFGAVFAGQWLPKAMRNRVREKMKSPSDGPTP